MSAHKPSLQHSTPKESSNKHFRRDSLLKDPSIFIKDKELLHTDTLSSLLESKACGSILSLEDQFIGDKGSIILINFLANQAKFTSIELRGNNLSPQSFVQICQVLKKSSNLTNLKLDWNLIGENSTAGVEALAELVKHLPSLQAIDLRNNQIGKGTGPFLASIIRDCSSLQRIDLRWNDLGDTEARQILSALLTDPRQIKINIGGNKIGGNKISEALVLEINKVSNRKHPEISSPYASSTKGHSRSSSVCLHSNSQSEPGNHPSEDTAKKSVLRPISYNSVAENSNEKARLAKSPGKKNIQKTSQRNETFGSPRKSKDDCDIYDKQSRSSPEVIKLKKISYSPGKNQSGKENQDLSLTEDRLIKAEEGLLSNKNSKYPDIVSRNEIRQAYREMQQRSRSNSPVKQPFEKSLTLNALSEKTNNLIGMDNFLMRLFELFELDLNRSATSEQLLARSPEQEVKSRGLRDSYLREAEENHHHQRSLNSKELQALVNDSFRNAEPQAHDFRGQRYHQMEREIAEERRLRHENEQKHVQLEEALKNSQSRAYELEISNKRLLQDYERLRILNKDLTAQLVSKGTEHHTLLKDQEEKHVLKIDALNEQIALLEKEIAKIKEEHEFEMQRVTNEWDSECKKIDRQVKEMTQLLEKVSLDHENEIKKIISQVQEEEKEKTQKALKELEESFNNKRNKRASPAREIGSFNSSEGKPLRSQSPVAARSGDYSKKLANIEASEKEIERILSDNRKLKNQLSEAIKISEQLESELNLKERALRKPEDETSTLLKDSTKLKENHSLESSLTKNEKKKWEQNEKALKSKIQQLESGIAHAREDSAKARLEYDKLKDLIQGNVHKIISQTFSAHQSSAVNVKRDRSPKP